MANFTEEENHTQSILQRRCFADGLSAGIHVQLTYLSAFNIFLSITAVLGNIMILAALRKESSLHPPSKVLFRCLATTDLCVGLIVQPLCLAYWMSLIKEDPNFCHYLFASFLIVGYALCLVSLLTVTAISVDRLLALLLGLRHREVVTLNRTYVFVVIVWILSTVASTSYLINGYVTLWCGCLIIPLCLVTSIVSYCKIFLTLHHRQTQVHADYAQQQQPSQMNPLNIARYKKALSSALWIQCTLVACYFPYGIFSGFHNHDSELSSFEALAFVFTVTLVFFNSSLNPFLYYWKIKEVKQAVKQTIREALCCLSG